MPNPTPTIFLPYHALDNVILRGTRASQPAAANVTPGTLYCVTDEQKVERSSGSAWELFSSGAVLPGNIAYVDVANVFTQPQSMPGVIFPAVQVPSANANTQDDYRESSWTPGLSFGGATTGITYDTAVGRYVKIGRLVLLSGRLFLSNKGSATGNALLTGLPFLVSATSAYGSGTPVAKFLNMTGIIGWFSLLASDGTTRAELWNGAALGNANCTPLTQANFANNSDFNFQLAYIASD